MRTAPQIRSASHRLQSSQGPQFQGGLRRIMRHLDVEIVKRSDAAKGFTVLPKRWIVVSVTADPHSDRGCRRRILPCSRGGYGASSCERPGITTGTLARVISVWN
jgi:hypothetical protein